MNIFLISRGIPSKRDPQWGCFEKDQAEALASLGHKIVVLSVDCRFRLFRRKIGVTHKKINGIAYLNLFYIPTILFRMLGGERLGLFIKKKLLDLLYKYAIKIYGKPDVLYSHYLRNTYVSIYLKKKYNIPLIAIEHWSEMMNLSYSTNLYKLASYTYENVDKLIAVSKPLKERIYTAFKKDSVVIPNILGQEFVNYEQKSTNRDRVNFISIGSLIHGKSYDTLITAFSNLEIPHDKWHLTIIGDGPLKNSLLEQSKSCGLESNITFEGKKTKEEIVEFLSDSDVFVLASKSETFGVVFIEALSQGLPCITTLCGGPEDIINESNGLLVPVNDINALVKAIIYMLENYTKYDRRKISEDCITHFSSEVISKQLEKIFEQTILEYNKI